MLTAGACYRAGLAKRPDSDGGLDESGVVA